MLHNPGQKGTARKKHQPLADGLRPRSFDDFIGQEHLVGQLEAAQKGSHLQSLLFFGPPGCGKSTLALLLAKQSGLEYLRVSAPEAGIGELRKRIAGIDILVLDELHRFSKAQQDFFLPLLESGAVILLASTTENPSFSVTRQLLSRLHVLKLESLTAEDLVRIARRGAKALGQELPDESLELLAATAGGDARTLLNLLELVVKNAKQDERAEDLSATALKKILPGLLLHNDRTGDSHYELASAFIKSIRGSDPDAAVYYLACLLESGEDPRFVTRRLIISAGEDIGLADPHALSLAVSCHQAVEAIGMPEGFIPMAETAVYLALTEKSNTSYMAYHQAAAQVRQYGVSPVPLHLRNAATSLQKDWGLGQGYLYPHDYPRVFVAQSYLPKNLAGKKFYTAKEQGRESILFSWWKKRTGRI